MQTVLTLLFLCCVTMFMHVVSERVSMKIVEEPSSYGINSYNNNFGSPYENAENSLKMRIVPSNFSGPPHFHRMYGKCFSKTDDSYKYEMCPFYNVTQHEQSLRWNPYNGILGVYQEWEIENNTFVAMVMREGDKCGSIFRSSKVFFRCGDKHELMNVTEPDTCQYHVVFKTPYVCHPHSMLVYPTLSKELQDEWDDLEGQLYRHEITNKGYKKYLRKIFEKAGYCISEKKKQKIASQAVIKENKVESESNGVFESLSKCTEEYQELKKEVEGLRTLLALQENNKDKKPDEEPRHDTYGELEDHVGYEL